ncbi:magnesium/cobalt transporter CorA [Pseudoxanthomonas dokdonensis]|uniref:Magnesium transport protein CorA n=1 Tax=Pseudoxanthomonas dokdonensis TaxID=344882 RepID=A0A0R0CU49_9GAMM|nr:magnesium/cobalt transporter CorA [Pseudoxanthomonas dokdonensis]KRG69850.1 magnesium transporter CorA [Pseudoxanthomonas dokdonensis]
MQTPTHHSPPPADKQQPASVINCVVYDRHGMRRDIGLDEISDVLAVDDGSFVWVGLYEPAASVLYQLQDEFQLHDLAVEDAQNAHQRTKLETYGNSFFAVMRTAQEEHDHIDYGETHAFLGPRYLVTVRHGKSRSYTGVRERVQREPEMLSLGPSYCLYAVMDCIVDNYRPIVDSFHHTLDALEKDIFSDNFRRVTVLKLYDLKRELTRMRLAVAPLQDVLAQLSRSQSSLVPDEVRLYFRDVHDHAQRVNEATDTLREMLTSAMNLNLSLVTLAQGETVKRLGAWAALLAAPTLITSWYGMNFHHMPELDGRHAYPLLIVAVAGVCGGLYWWFKRARWL